ncbi:uncharacterized protein LOC135144991 isoform X2 [Zophobas morio]|uniref:uncharacterized protein LOC135144991 isoform X2 n=1 Tax=Zophobas morio TaxID=2755281 RepID=UPI00308315CE
MQCVYLNIPPPHTLIAITVTRAMTPSTEPLENAPFIKVSNHNNNDPHLAQHAGQRFAILGDFAQLLEVELKPGQSFRSEPGSMVYMKNIKSLKIETGGFGDACLRSCCAGEDFFRVNYVNKTSELAYVGIAPALPSKIIALDLSQYPEGIIYKNGAFLGTFDLNVNFNYKTTGSVAAGCFGGQGFVLNICKANTFTFFNACGTIIEKYLADGEILLVDTNAVVLMEF